MAHGLCLATVHTTAYFMAKMWGEEGEMKSIFQKRLLGLGLVISQSQHPR